MRLCPAPTPESQSRSSHQPRSGLAYPRITRPTHKYLNLRPLPPNFHSFFRSIAIQSDQCPHTILPYCPTTTTLLLYYYYYYTTTTTTTILLLLHYYFIFIFNHFNHRSLIMLSSQGERTTTFAHPGNCLLEP